VAFFVLSIRNVFARLKFIIFHKKIMRDFFKFRIMLHFTQIIPIKTNAFIFGACVFCACLLGLFSYPNILQSTFFHFCLMGFCALPMLFFRLKTTILLGAIHFRMVPFHWKDKVIKADNIAKLDLQTGNFYWKFLGFGIKYNGEGWAYFLANEKMLHITLRNGEHIWLGLPKHADLSSIQQTIDNL
jgi:hypothetical protein